MNYKYLALILLGIIFIFETVIKYFDTKSAERPIPENVADVYDEEAYKKWLAYDKELNRLSLFRHVVSAVFSFVLIGCNVYAGIINSLGNVSENLYSAAVLVLVFDALIGEIWAVPFSYVSNMKIEQKYGFNRMTMKTFIVDEIKSLIISTGVISMLICLLVLIHQALGNWMLIIFTAVVVAVVLVMNFLSPVFVRIFNKLTPLEEGELRTKLLALLEANDCTVRDVYVTDGSRRSTKANAYFGGFGKMKTIVLFDTLIEQMTEEEIVAVFAHEMGHNKHKDTLRMLGISILNIILMVVMIWGLVSLPEIYGFFGFAGVNYGFAFILLASVCLAFVSPLLNLLSSGFSRKQEYAADKFAAENGYGEALVSALKKLARNNFACLNPHPVVVKLSYSHPTISQRVEALEKYKSEE